MTVRRSIDFVEPCLPSKAEQPPSGPLWVHEIKRDGYRLMVRRDGAQVRCFTRNGNDWANRFPAIVDAALRLKATMSRPRARAANRFNRSVQSEPLVVRMLRSEFSAATVARPSGWLASTFRMAICRDTHNSTPNGRPR